MKGSGCVQLGDATNSANAMLNSALSSLWGLSQLCYVILSLEAIRKKRAKVQYEKKYQGNNLILCSRAE